MRDVKTAYILCLVGLLGVAGLHRFYLGKHGTALLWLVTGGLFGIGTLYDLLTLPTQVRTVNDGRMIGSERNAFSSLPDQHDPAPMRQAAARL